MARSSTRRALARSSSEVRFRTFLARDWAQWMAEYPEHATRAGHPGLNDRWTDGSPEGIAARDRHLRESSRALREFDRTTLGPNDRLNHRLYGNLLALAVAGRRFGDDPLPFHYGFPRNLWMPLNQMEGIHTDVGEIVPMQPRRTASDYEAILARLRAVPRLVEQTVAQLEEGRRSGYTASRVAIRGVPDQVRSLVPEDPTSSVVWDPFREIPATLEPQERSRLTDQAREAYAGSVRPAFLRLHRYLAETYLPAARASVGASDLPGGPEAYAHHARWTTTTELTPKQIHEIGQAEVRRTEAEIAALVRSTGFSGSLAEFHAFLRTDPKFRSRSEAEYVDGFRILAKRIDPELARHFGRLPRLPYGVEPVPAYQAPSVPAAYYIQGAPREGRPGIFYANTHNISSRLTWRMESLTLHEAVPGHHLQIALTLERDDLPEFRRFSWETSFTEGWGLYAETLGAELGLNRDPYARFGALDHDIWRSVRLVVDTGMHALGWSREQAIAFFQAHTSLSEPEIVVEVDRYIVWGGQALAYKIGQLKLLELRRLAETSLGERFDERAFHDAVLEEGGVPLGELETRVRAWIRSRAAPASGPGRRAGRGHRPSGGPRRSVPRRRGGR